MYKLVVKKEFSSAHVLHGHPGDCKRMHGHNWIVEAKVEGNNINKIGMVIDFKDIKNILSDIISKLGIAGFTITRSAPSLKSRSISLMASFLFE